MTIIAFQSTVLKGVIQVVDVQHKILLIQIYPLCFIFFLLEPFFKRTWRLNLTKTKQ